MADYYGEGSSENFTGPTHYISALKDKPETKGYHLVEIPKGTLGTPSKIDEEYLEFKDAHAQDNVVMELVELSDLLGAIDAYVANYNLTIDDLVVMMRTTQRAFKNGGRS